MTEGRAPRLVLVAVTGQEPGSFLKALDGGYDHAPTRPGTQALKSGGEGTPSLSHRRG